MNMRGGKWEGQITFFNCLQHEKGESDVETSTAWGRYTSFKFLQLPNASFSIISTLSGIEIFNNDSQFSNALIGITLRLLEKVISFNNNWK